MAADNSGQPALGLHRLQSILAGWFRTEGTSEEWQPVIVRKPRKPQLPLLEKQSLSPRLGIRRKWKAQGLRLGLPSQVDHAFGGPMKRYLPLLLAVTSFFSALTPTPCSADEIPKTAWRRHLGQPLPNQ